MESSSGGAKGSSGDVDWKYDDEWKRPKQNRTLLQDLGTDIKRGAQQLPGALTGIADIPVAAITGERYVSRAADALGEMAGFQPGKWAEEVRSEYSDRRQQGSADIDRAWEEGGVSNIASAYARNPGNVAGLVAESLPSMVAGGLAGRAVLSAGRAAGAIARPATAARAARHAAAGGAVGEGAVIAGQTMDEIGDAVDARRAAAAAVGVVAMSDEHRRIVAPDMTADTDSADVIVTFNGRDVVNAPPPANARSMPPDPAQAVRITPTALLRAFEVQFPRLAPAVRTMLERGRRGEQGGVVLIDSTDTQQIARTFASKTGRSMDRAVELLQSDAGAPQGFFDPRSGLTFLVGPQLDLITAPAVLLHEMTHGQQRQKIDARAMAMLENRARALPKERAFLERVAARMADAGETGNAREATAYIVEQALIEGRNQGFTAADSEFLSWVERNVSKKVADVVRSFIVTVRGWAVRHGVPLTGRITVDDLVSYAMAGVDRAARGEVRANRSANQTRADAGDGIKDAEPTAPAGPGAQLSRTARAIHEVIDAARSSGHAPQKAELGEVSSWLSREAKERAGLNIEGFTHVLDGSAVRHTMKNHYNAQAERSRGQIAVTDGDLVALPEVVQTPDRVVFGTTNRLGRDQIVLVKRMQDGSILYLEEVRAGRKELAAVSVRKYPATMNVETIISTLHPNAQGDGGRALIVVAPPVDGNNAQIPKSRRGRVRRENLPDAIVANPLGAAAGPDHDAAKAGDVEAAGLLARKLVTPELIARLRSTLPNDAVVVAVDSIEATGANALPSGAAHLIATELGLRADEHIVQSTKPKRTTLGGFERVFRSPEFDGAVEPGRAYVIVDDTLTQGGTFAALASHIEQNGGRVVAAVALTGKQYSSKLSPEAADIERLRTNFGDLEDAFRQTTGYGFDGLTASEARYLANFRPPVAVRNRILAEAQAGAREGLRGDVSQEVTPSRDDDAPQFSRAGRAIDAAGAVIDRTRDLGRRATGRDSDPVATQAFPDLSAAQQQLLSKIGASHSPTAEARRSTVPD